MFNPAFEVISTSPLERYVKVYERMKDGESNYILICTLVPRIAPKPAYLHALKVNMLEA